MVLAAVFTFVWLSEQLVPTVKLLYSSLSELQKALSGFLYAFLMVETRFRIEFVCVTNDFFLHTHGLHVAMWKRPLATDDLLKCESRSCVSFAHECVPLVSFASHHFGSYEPVTNVWFISRAEDGWGVGSHNADVVQHCSLPQEILVET